MDVFGKLSEMISQVGYSPISQSQASKPTYTLHTVLRDLCNMAKRETKNPKVESSSKNAMPQEVHISADDADVSYWDFLTLRNYLEKITELIDTELSLLLGKNTHFAPWANDNSRTLSEVVSLLSSLSKKYPNLPPPPKAVARPQAKDMVGRGKIESAIANTLSVLVGNGARYGEILDTIAERLLDNEELLVELDKQVENKKCDRKINDKKSLIPRTIVQSYLKFKNDTELGTHRVPTLARFLKDMNAINSFSDISDEMLIKRLQAV